MTSKQPAQAFQVLISLDESQPAVWRRVLVSEKASLLELHEIIQSVLPWQDYHLHEFTIDGQHYGDPQSYEGEGPEILDERNFTLIGLGLGEGSRFNYTYDFGDGWSHTLTIEKSVPVEKGAHLPACLSGEQACPPEDVGGWEGYGEFLAAISDPNHEQHAELLEWIGGDFDPHTFNVEAANTRLAGEKQRDWFGRMPVEVVEGDQRARSQLDPFTWGRFHNDNWELGARELALRKDAAALLGYLKENKVTGTQSTGNFPRQAVAEIAARFVDPPSLNETVGDRTFHFRSEEEIWPVYFVHVLVQGAGLVKGGPSRRWQVTSLGDDYLSLPAVAQVWDLFITWWYSINWKISSPINEVNEISQEQMRKVTVDLLKDAPVRKALNFDDFVKRFFAAAGVPPREGDQEIARLIRHGLIDQMVIDPLEGFGVLTVEREPDIQYAIDVMKAKRFQVTEFGGALLAAV